VLKSLEYVWLLLSGMPRPADQCPWSGVPNTIAHLTEAHRTLESRGIDSSLPSIEQLSRESWCEGLDEQLVQRATTAVHTRRVRPHSH